MSKIRTEKEARKDLRALDEMARKLRKSEQMKEPVQFITSIEE